MTIPNREWGNREEDGRDTPNSGHRLTVLPFVGEQENERWQAKEREWGWRQTIAWPTNDGEFPRNPVGPNNSSWA